MSGTVQRIAIEIDNNTARDVVEGAGGQHQRVTKKIQIRNQRATNCGRLMCGESPVQSVFARV